MTTRSKAEKPAKPGSGQQAQDREARLKAALKANLARRKSQARKRAEGPDGENAVPPKDN